MFRFRPFRRLRRILVTGALLALVSGALLNGRAIDALALQVVGLRTGDPQLPGIVSTSSSVDLGTVDEPSTTVFGGDPQDVPFVEDGINLFRQLIEFGVEGFVDTLRSPPDESERTIPRLDEIQSPAAVEQDPLPLRLRSVQALSGAEGVVLVTDASDVDQYGRLLRYVYVGETFVNSRLVESGYAEAIAYPPDTQYADFFESLETEARMAGLGCHPTGVFE